MYIIKKVSHNIVDINDAIWDKANVANININNWKQFEYVPGTFAKLLYNDEYLFVKLWTDEKPLLARHTEQNSRVCDDSCMEFFFCPNQNDKRYMNFEFNPFGTMYFAIRSNRHDATQPEKDRNFFNVQSVVTDKFWTLQFAIPFSYIDEVFSTHTKTMLGNLYKCGEHTEREHYLSFYPLHPVDIDFHRSEYFKEFVLE